jgi:syntaxin 1B/2/3
MVDQQGETLDRIEDNVNSAAVQLEQGTTHLEKAVDSARAARKKRWCLFITFMIILIIIVVVVLIYVLPKTGTGSSSSAPAPTVTAAPANSNKG